MDQRAMQARKNVRESFGKFPKPDWAVWESIQSAPLWQLVALAVDIDPFALSTWNTLNPAVVPSESFHGLLRRAITAVEAGDRVLIGVSKIENDLSLSKFLVGNFREWALSLAVKLPLRFPCSALVRRSEWSDEDKLRMTLEITAERQKRTKPFFKTVADRYGISPQRLYQIVGTTAARKERIRKSQS
jgi:hypothetical protein